MQNKKWYVTISVYLLAAVMSAVVSHYVGNYLEKREKLKNGDY